MSPNSGLPGSSVRSFQRLAVPWCLDRATHTQTPSRWNRSHNLPLHGLLNGVFQVPEFTLKLLHLIVRGELDTSQRRSFALDPDVSCFSSILPDPEHGRVRDLNRRCLDRVSIGACPPPYPASVAREGRLWPCACWCCPVAS